MKVFWTPQAEQTFDENIDYLIANWGEAVIAAFIEKTEQSIQLISKNPHLFPTLNRKKQIHRCLIVKQISLYYRVNNDQIDLLMFWNNYKNPKRMEL